MKKHISNQKLAQFHFALGHPRCLRIIDALNEATQGMTFEMLEAETLIFGASLSHHLRFLKEADIIHRNIKDRFSIYRLDAAYLDLMTNTRIAKPRQKAA